MKFIRILSISIGLLITPFSGIYSQSSPEDFTHLFGIESGLETTLRVAVDHEDNIYVTDVILKCVMKFDKNGNLVETLAQGAFPVSVAISPLDELFYGDGETGYINKIDSAGQIVNFYTGAVYPSSLVFSPDNVLYVSDNQLKQVLVIDLSGDLIRTIGAGTLVFPTGLAFDARNNRILVSEHGGIGGDVPGCGSGMFGKGPLVKVYMFDIQGNIIGSFGCFGNGDGKFYRTQGITIGRCGNIYLCEPFQGSINVFTENGIFITRFGEYGSREGELNLPMDIVFDSQDRIIISCYNKGSLELFTIIDSLPSAAILNPDIAVCEGQQADISIQLNGTPPWSFTYTHDGEGPISIESITSSPYILSVFQPGDYLVTTVSDSSSSSTCISGAAHVSWHPEPTSTISCGDQVICHGDSVEIPIYFTGDSPWTFTCTRDGLEPVTHSTTQNPYMLQAHEPGLYTVTALTGRNCEGSIFNGNSQITVRPLPSATFNEGDSIIDICGNVSPVMLSISLTGSSPWTFIYTVDSINPIVVQTSENPYMLAATLPGTYEIPVVSDNYCLSTNTSGHPEIIYHAKPTAQITASKLGLCPSCVNYFPIQFTGTPPWTFTMTRNGYDPVTTVTGDNPYLYPASKVGMYQITTIADKFCHDYPSSVGINVVSVYPPSAKLPSQPIPFCEGQSALIQISFKGSPPFTFAYLHDGLDLITLISYGYTYLLTVCEPGEYKLTSIIDANCAAVKLPPPAIVVQYDMPVADFSYSVEKLTVSFINASANAVQYMWLFGDGDSSSVVNPVHVYPAFGDYTVTLKAFSANCGYSVVTDTITLAGMKNTWLDGSHEENERDPADGNDEIALRLYPNPCAGIFTLELEGPCSGDIFVDVISMTGQSLLSSKFIAPNDKNRPVLLKQQVDLGPFAGGIYQVQVRCGDLVKRRLLVVMGK